MSIHTHHHPQMDAGHGHSHPHGDAKLNQAFAIAIFLTLSYCGFETIFAILANSMSLLADAAHNLGDVLGLILAWIANWLLTIPPRKRYSYGFKRTTIIAALANAFILVGTSVLIAYESINKLLDLKPIDEQTVIIVGIVGIIVNLGTSLLFMRSAKHDLNIKGAFLHLMADALILSGVVIGAIVIKFTGIVWIDPVLGLIIVGIVLWGTWGLLRHSIHLILDAVPQFIDQPGVENYLKTLPGVKAVHDLHIWGLSTREVALTAHLVMPDEPLSDADYRVVNQVLHEQFNVNHVTLQIEKGSLEDPCLRSDKC